MDEFLHLVSDPAHWGFELVSDVVFALVGAVYLKLHDRKHHGD